MPPFGAANISRSGSPGWQPPASGTRELPDDIDALDAELGTLRGQSLAMTDGFHTWMRLRVIPLTPSGQKPTVVLGDVEFLLLGHSRAHNYLELTVEDAAYGTQGTLRLTFPASGWRLHAVLPTAPAWAVPPGAWGTPRSAPPQADADAPHPPPGAPDAPDQPPTAPPQADAEGAARRKRDAIFRRMFS
jgi:hypothetical protein